MNPVIVPEDTGYGLEEFDKTCSKKFPITYYITAVSFPTPLQSSLRKLGQTVSQNATQLTRRGKTFKVKVCFFYMLLLFPTDMPCGTKRKFVFPLKYWHFEKSELFITNL